MNRKVNESDESHFFSLFRFVAAREMDPPSLVPIMNRKVACCASSLERLRFLSRYVRNQILKGILIFRRGKKNVANPENFILALEGI